MTSVIGKTLSLSVILIFLMVACTDSVSPQADVGAEVTDEPAVEPTSTPQPTATSQPTATIEPTASASEAVATPEFELATHQVGSTGLSFDYPSDWIITENASGSIRIESEAGYAERIDTDAGAVVVIIPMAADDLTGQDSLEKLATYIINHEPSPSTQLGDPTTMMLNDQELTFSAFVNEEAGIEGIYAAILTGDELAVVFAVAGGDSRTSFGPAVEAIVNSLILPQTG
ncbi:MAG: hypothetical protein PVG33_14365 [Chloroflexota bacterium]|jgi:hypothetical protein